MRRSLRRLRLLDGRRKADALLALVLSTTALYGAPAVCAASSPSLVVVPRPASGASLSYFKLALTPRSTGQAGAIELRNPTGRTMRVALAPVDGQTLDTLGSSYAQPGSGAHGPTRWLHVGHRRVTLAPGGTAVVPVSVAVPGTARPGDYLSGVSVEALGQSQTASRHGVSIASVERYAIGVETSLPGARYPRVQFTGAGLRRQPAGLVFLLDARNAGNVILQGVHGGVRISRAGRTILSRAIEPGTFVTGTRIAYPVPAFGQTPSQGTRYHISAWLRYVGGIARLDTTVIFGHREAVIQQQYGGPHVSGGGIAWWKIALGAGVILYALATTVLLMRRRARPTASG